MSKSAEAVKKWRRKTKGRIVKAMGGRCVCCGYDRCLDALESHHLDPSIKEFSFGSIRGNPTSWASIVKELRKCVLVCANCHREIHSGVRTVPDNASGFNEDFAEYRNLDPVELEPCPICGGDKEAHLITCSRECAGRKARRVDWDNVDLKGMLENSSIVRVAERLGVSDMAVRKRMKKINL